MPARLGFFQNGSVDFDFNIAGLKLFAKAGLAAIGYCKVLLKRQPIIIDEFGQSCGVRTSHCDRVDSVTSI